MFDYDKWQEIFSTMMRHKLRTALTAFGVFWGIFMLVVLLSSGNGLENAVTRDFGSISANSFFVWGQKTTKPYNGMQPGRFVRLTNEDTDAIRAQVPEVEYIAPRLNLDGVVQASYGERSGNFTVNGDVPDLLNIEYKVMSRGRFINDDDMQDSRKVAVIGEFVAEVLFGKDTNPLGKYINIRGVYFQVVGTFRSKRQGERGAGELRTIYIPFTTFQRVFNVLNRVDYYSLTAHKNIPASVAEKKVREVIRKRHQVDPEDTFAIGSFNLQAEFQKINGLFLGIRLFMWIVGIGTLIAGVVGVSNIMLIVVQERTKEIGVRKALGATPWSVISLVVQESIFLTSMAGFTGLVAGVWLMEMLSNAIGDDRDSFIYNPTIDFRIALLATAILIISGAFAGIIPATRAASIQPIEALRAE